jgi:hypothetical protein
LFDVRPARNALTIFFSYFQLLIDKSIITLTQHNMHGRRVLDVQCSAFVSFFFDLTGRFSAGGWAEPRTLLVGS